VKEYNESKFGSYIPLPNQSKYNDINAERLKNPKFTFRKTVQFVDNWRVDKIDSWTDIGCSNGEFIHYLVGKYDETDFVGIDVTPEFVETAKELLSDFSNVEIFCDNVIDPDGQIKESQIVSCLGTFQIFPDPEHMLNSLLNIVESGGL
jgi:trans-aconitate methyltransferase